MIKLRLKIKKIIATILEFFRLKTNSISTDIDFQDNSFITKISNESITDKNKTEYLESEKIKTIEEEKREEQEILIYAAMCEKHAREQDYIESLGLNPEDYNE